jgi:hypothetical protein
MEAERFAKGNQAPSHRIVIAVPHFCLGCGISASLAEYRALVSGLNDRLGAIVRRSKGHEDHDGNERRLVASQSVCHFQF